MNNQYEDELRKVVNALTGELCWAISSVGSWIILDFGKKIPRSRPIKNPLCDEELRFYTGSILLDIFCDWKLYTQDDSILFTSENYDDEMESMKRLDILKGRKVLSSLLSENKDLLLVFDNEIQLHVATDPYEDISYNYGIYLPDVIYGVMPKGEIIANPRDKY